MTYQDNFAISILSLFLAGQHTALGAMETKLRSLTERVDVAGDRHQQLDDHLISHDRELANVDAKLHSLVGRADGQELGFNIVLCELLGGFKQQQSAIEQLRAMVLELAVRVDWLDQRQWEIGRASRMGGLPPKSPRRLEQRANTRRPARKKLSASQRASKRS